MPSSVSQTMLLGAVLLGFLDYRIGALVLVILAVLWQIGVTAAVSAPPSVPRVDTLDE